MTPHPAAAMLALSIAWIGYASAQAPSGATSASAERKAEVARAIDEWAEARVRGDAAFLERFYGAELQIGTADGGVVTRGDDIALFAARQIKPEFIRNTDVTVKLYGRTAIVTSIENLKGTYRGMPGEMSLRMLNVLAHRDGRWQLIATQSARIPKR